MNAISLDIPVLRPRPMLLWSQMGQYVVQRRYLGLSPAEPMTFGDRELSDIGLTRIDSYEVVRKPFWH